MAFAELVKSVKKGAGTTLESSAGNLARRMQATQSPCLAVLSQSQTGDSDLNAEEDLKLTIYLLMVLLMIRLHQIHMDTHTILRVSLLESPQPLNGVQFTERQE